MYVSKCFNNKQRICQEVCIVNMNICIYVNICVWVFMVIVLTKKKYVHYFASCAYA